MTFFLWSRWQCSTSMAVPNKQCLWVAIALTKSYRSRAAIAPSPPKTYSPASDHQYLFQPQSKQQPFRFPSSQFPLQPKNMNKFCSQENCKTVTFHLFDSFESDSGGREIELVYQKSSKVIACKKLLAAAVVGWNRNSVGNFFPCFREPDEAFLRD